MNKNARTLVVAAMVLLSGCSSEMAKRSAYDSLQYKSQLDCQQHPGSACADQKSYDDYQRSLNKQNDPGR